MENFISENDIADPEELLELISYFKENPLAYHDTGRGRSMCMLFFNPSLRTRLSTEKAAFNLGLFCSIPDMTGGWKLEFREGVKMDQDRSEHIKEAAAVIGQYHDVIGVRSFPGLTDREEDYREEVLHLIQKYSKKSIINLESATRHPLQGLTDVFTIGEAGLPRPRVVLTWAPHVKSLPQAVPNSFVAFNRLLGNDLVITHPPGYELPEQVTGDTPIIYDQEEALRGADFVYAKNWSSYREYGKILSQDASWMVTAEKMKLARTARFMHCLPVRRKLVVEDAVLDGPNSIAIQQAGNRVFAVQAVLYNLLRNQK